MPLEHNMILSASGWRKVFAQNGGESGRTTKIGIENQALCFLAAQSFAEWLKKAVGKTRPKIVVGTDTRPTKTEAARFVLKALASEKVRALFLGASAAPEIMACARRFDGFVYISASHNPIGHNGIKFGLDTGGVLDAAQNAEVRAVFERKLREAKSARAVLREAAAADISAVLLGQGKNKEAALESYRAFSRRVISDEEKAAAQNTFFSELKASAQKKGIAICADFNGSARAASIDKNFFMENGADFKSINSRPGQIVHEIIPEPENLGPAARLVEETARKSGKKNVIGYMPDCDGDRGNIVYFSQKEKRAKILKAQEVFALSVLAELSYSAWLSKRRAAQEAEKRAGEKAASAGEGKKNGAGRARRKKIAVCANCPTSMRIEEIAAAFGAKVFRAEVGEANVVALANEKRARGWEARILGEGSNGGTITYPASVRDPLNTVFALVKLLSLDGILEPWEKARKTRFGADYSLDDIMDSLPRYSATGVSERRAVLKIKTGDQALLKKNFQNAFESSFKNGAGGLLKKYGITSWKAFRTNGTKEAPCQRDFSKSKTGGLKIALYEKGRKKPAAFIWMRGSGTEPVFRILCDVKGTDSQKERTLLKWESELLAQADKMR